MCGIIGYIGKQQATPILIEGLRRLEYRGYDSAGVAVLQNRELGTRKKKGKIDEGLAKLRQAAKTRKIVLVPSHKSHIDYLVMSNLFYRYGLMPPHIAAGINLNFWPIGGLFRGAGAFFLRRSFAGDILYEWVFKTYLVKVLSEVDSHTCCGSSFFLVVTTTRSATR